MRVMSCVWRVLAILGCLAACLAACGDNGASSGDDDDDGSGGRTTATVTVQRAGTGHGEIAAQGVDFACGAVCTATVAIGSTITVVATPDAGAVFGGWTAPGCSTDAACTVTVTRDTTLTAVFDVQMFTVEVELLGAGMGVVMSSAGGLVCPGACSVRVAVGTAITLTAAPTSSSVFLGWSDACIGDACALTVDADKHIGATFAKQNELVVVKAGSGGGTVTAMGIDCGTDCSELYQAGTVVELTATPDADSTFAGWSGGGCTGSGACAVTIDAAMQVTATFALQTRRLTVLKPTGSKGTVTSDPSGVDCGVDCPFEIVNFPIHSTVVLTATPATDWTFSGWAGACTGAGTCTITLDSDAVVDAIFLPLRYRLSVIKAGAANGAVTSAPAGIACGTDCDEYYDVHAQVALTAVPNADAVFVGWSGGGCSGTGTCTVTMEAQTEETATFAYVKRTLTVDKLGNGSGVVSATGIDCGSDCTESYDAHTAVTLHAAPDANSNFVGWSGACSGSGDCTLVLHTDATATATFALKQFALSVTLLGAGNGTVTSQPAGIACPGDCVENYDINTIVALVATPAAGTKLVAWGGACSGATTCQVSLAAARAVTARFEAASMQVADFTTGRISTFLATDSGDKAALFSVFGDKTQLRTPRGIFVSNGELFIADPDRKAISVFLAGSAGNIAPLRRITSSSLSNVTSVAVHGGELYASQAGAVLVFPLSANGNVAPTRILFGLGTSAYIAIADGEIYASDYVNNRILVFPASSPSGVVTPTRILGGLAMPFTGVDGVFVDGNELFVTSINSPRVSVYDKSAQGSAAPLRVITGPSLGYPDQVVVFNNEIYVADYTTMQIVVFPRSASGNAAPTRQLLGAQPGMNPAGVWVY